MAEERTYNIPLRREWLKVPRYKRTKKAVKAVKEFITRHMKVGMEKVKIGKDINDELWKHGIKNPPHHIKVIITKDDEGNITAGMAGVKKKEKKEEKKEEKTVEEPEKSAEVERGAKVEKGVEPAGKLNGAKEETLKEAVKEGKEAKIEEKKQFKEKKREENKDIK